MSASTFAHGHALVIGIGDYQEPELITAVPAAEASAVAQALRDPEICAYPDSQVRLITKDDTTHAKVALALDTLAQEAGPDDTALLFIAGHGLLGTDGRYYFACSDTLLNSRQQAEPDAALPAAVLLDKLRAIRARKLLLILDACFSGHVQPTLGGGPAAAPRPPLGAPPSAALGPEILATGEGRVLITASRPTQSSYYPLLGDRSYFGNALIEGLNGTGVQNSGGYIGLYELYDHLYARVSRTAADLGLEQEPVLTILSQVGPFPIAHFRGDAPSSAALGAPPIRQEPPQGAAVSVIEKKVVTAIGAGARAVSVEGGNTQVGEVDTLIYVGPGAHVGNITTGDMAKGNLIKISGMPAEAAGAGDQARLMELIAETVRRVAELTKAPKVPRQNVQFNLQMAREAAQAGDRASLLEYLETAHKLLVTLGGDVPEALKLGEAVGAQLQRAMALWF